ncbi:hypothetical protein LL998_19895 [Burkholderia ambifaria]|uniref:hypothetical protein n=1 Tax=Burkholderia ambifaria TaxID=152480 RepID=UPI001E3598B6|nr:hypothetical protein [Burkholderia ambifaria]UEP38224.1 hypothetical protein LL998_19895 [Burkholderia ambifaria]
MPGVIAEAGGAVLVKNGSLLAQRADAGVDACLPEKRLARRGPKPRAAIGKSDTPANAERPGAVKFAASGT